MFLRGMNWIIDRLIKIPLDFLGAFHISQRILDPLLVWFQKDISRPAHQLYILTCRWHFLEVRSYSRESKNHLAILNMMIKTKHNLVLAKNVIIRDMMKNELWYKKYQLTLIKGPPSCLRWDRNPHPISYVLAQANCV